MEQLLLATLVIFVIGYQEWRYHKLKAKIDELDRLRVEHNVHHLKKIGI